MIRKQDYLLDILNDTIKTGEQVYTMLFGAELAETVEKALKACWCKGDVFDIDITGDKVIRVVAFSLDEENSTLEQLQLIKTIVNVHVTEISHSKVRIDEFDYNQESVETS